MKKYGIFVWVIVGIVCIVGCHTAKHVEKNEIASTAVEQHEETIAKTSTATQESVQIRVEDAATGVQWTRETEMDTTGIVRRIRETWRETGRTKLAIRDDRQRTISVTDTVHRDSVRTEEENTNTFTDKTKQDARPVQGIEWMWIAVGAGVLIVVVIAGWRLVNGK